MKFLQIFAAGVMSAGLLTVPAAAATFDFTNMEGTASTASFDAGIVDGLGLTVTAGVVETGPLAIVDDNSLVTFPVTGGIPAGGEGIGVTDNTDTNPDVDGFSDNDLLIFTFTHDVILGTIGFENVDTAGDDDEFFLLGIDPITAAITVLLGSTDISGTGFDSGSNTVGPFVGSIFGIGAFDSNDDFLVSSITVDKVAAVPLPAAFPLLAGGLGLMGFMGWRRKKVA